MKPNILKIKTVSFKALALLLCLSFFMLLAGCEEAPMPGEETTPPLAQDPIETISDDREEDLDLSQLDKRPSQESGPLRLWWKVDEARHPLLSSDRSTRAIYDLIYESLYRIDAEQQSQAALLASMDDPSETTHVRLTLQPGLQFHDGQSIQAEDVAASIEFILDHPESFFAPGLQQVEGVQVEGERQLVLTLRQPDPWLAYALTFPVLAAEALAEGLTLPPGSGDFAIEDHDDGDFLRLVSTREDLEPNDLQTIQVTAFDDFSKAMQAFFDDQLDLIHLPDEAYQQYRVRDSLRFDPFDAGIDLVLSYQTAGDAILSSHEHLAATKHAVHEAFSSLPTPVDGLVRLQPLPLNSYVLQGESMDVSSILDEFEQSLPAQPLQLIYPERDLLRSKLATALSLELENRGFEIELQGLTREVFRTRVQNEAYDLALLKMQAPPTPDPSWLHLGPSPASGQEGLWQKTGLEGYESFLDILDQSWHQRSPQRLPPGEQLSYLLSHVIARAPWDTLMSSQEALLYGNRVLGQSRPHRHRPYEGIFDLWVWSSPPSS